MRLGTAKAYESETLTSPLVRLLRPNRISKCELARFIRFDLRLKGEVYGVPVTSRQRMSTDGANSDRYLRRIG
jgi:hypothetical protein